MTIKIIVADDHKIMRDGLRALLEKQQGMEMVAEAENGRTAVHLAHKYKPDVVIMDISMPDLNGIEATRQIKANQSPVKIIALSMHSDKRFVVEMFKAGVSGYLLKEDCALDELSRAIAAVVAHQIYLSPSMAGIVVKDYVNHLAHEESMAYHSLTAREREVLQLIAEGRKTKQIANRLHISVKTVETHRRQIMEKLNIFNIAELTKFALREGLTALET